jgi:A/G-specific adenine glycosylase
MQPNSDARLAPSRRDAIRRRLLGWYARGRRDLPWRKTRDPFRIWLSETMLQQTRVETVVPYYERFLERFPTVEALALADEEDVLREWAGLGYYGRARNLKRAAELVVRDHGGRIPRDAEALHALPGVGRYTAGAVRSIAFRERAGLVDGNVGRVLARVQALASPGAGTLWSLAEGLVPDKHPGDFNQSLMELGATVCTPRSPACLICPLAEICRGRRSGSPERFPAARPRAQPRRMEAIAGVVRERTRRDAVLLVRRPSRGLLGGLWELPNVEGSDAAALRSFLRERLGMRTRTGTHLGRVEHVFTHRVLTLELVELKHTSGELPARDGASARWCVEADLGALPLSALMVKSLSLAGLKPPSRARASRKLV